MAIRSPALVTAFISVALGDLPCCELARVEGFLALLPRGHPGSFIVCGLRCGNSGGAPAWLWLVRPLPWAPACAF